MGKVEFGLGIGTGLLGASMALSGCGEAPTAPPTTTEAPGVTSAGQTQERLHGAELPKGFAAPVVGSVVLGPNNMCRWTPDNPQPQSSVNEFQIDGRCGFPMPESGRPEDDTPSGAYLCQNSLKIKLHSGLVRTISCAPPASRWAHRLKTEGAGLVRCG